MDERDGFMRNERAGVAAPLEVEPGEDSLLEMVLTEHVDPEAEPAPRLDGVVIGVLTGFGPKGEPWVDFGPNPAGEPVPARSAVALDDGAIGRQVALMFEAGDPARPMLMGLVHGSPVTPGAPSYAPSRSVEVEADGESERVVVSAEQELVLRCGNASITLTRAGKILIRGAYVLTRSSGVNRIQGGSVQIN